MRDIAPEATILDKGGNLRQIALRPPGTQAARNNHTAMSGWTGIILSRVTEDFGITGPKLHVTAFFLLIFELLQ